jgi:putative ABC transport system permease protein
MTALLTGLNERRREMAILRALGASPRAIFGLVLGESLLLTLGGIVLGALLLQALLLGALPLLAGHVGFAIPAWPPSPREAWLLGGVCGAGLLAGLVPALRVYRQSLADGMTIRLCVEHLKWEKRPVSSPSCCSPPAPLARRGRPTRRLANSTGPN